MKIVIELHQNYKKFSRKKVDRLNKWLAKLSILLTDGRDLDYIKTLGYNDDEDLEIKFKEGYEN